jgi:hypothetical protein
MDKELLERICIIEDKLIMERDMGKALARKLEEVIDHINDKLPPLQHTIGFMQGLLEEHEEEIDKLTKSNT